MKISVMPGNKQRERVVLKVWQAMGFFRTAKKLPECCGDQDIRAAFIIAEVAMLGLLRELAQPKAKR
jgi:hypothetical protein